MGLLSPIFFFEKYQSWNAFLLLLSLYTIIVTLICWWLDAQNWIFYVFFWYIKVNFCYFWSCNEQLQLNNSRKKISSANTLLAAKSIIMAILILNMSFNPFSLRTSDEIHSNFFTTYMKVFSSNSSDNDTSQNQNESKTLSSLEEIKEIIHQVFVLKTDLESFQFIEKQKIYFTYLSRIPLTHHEVLLQPPLS